MLQGFYTVIASERQTIAGNNYKQHGAPKKAWIKTQEIDGGQCTENTEETCGD